MAWVHSWIGLVFGWLLFIMFVTGSIGFYRHEINLWMTPELQPLVGANVDDALAARRGVDWLSAHAPVAESWTISLPDARSPALRVAWEDAKGTPAQRALDPRSGQPLDPAPRETRGADFLYRLHSDLHFIPAIAGRVMVGLAGIVLLVILVSGLFTHRHILRNLFRLRRGKGRRTWLDVHNLFGVLALPFHLMIAYTGLVVVMILMMPWGIVSNYGGAGLGGFARDAFEQPLPDAAGRIQPIVLAPIAPMVVQARRHWQGEHVGDIQIAHPTDTRAKVEIAHSIRGVLAMRKPALVFSGMSGRQLSSINENLSPAALLHSQTFGLHVAHFADPVTRLALFLLGLGGAGMVGTGMILWSMKRRRNLDGQQNERSWGLWTVDWLNLGVIAGLPVAIGVYLWANQLIPVDAAARSQREIDAFFWGWAGAFIIGALLPARWGWAVVLSLGGAMFLTVPVPGWLSGHSSAWGVSVMLQVIGGGMIILAARNGRGGRSS